RNASLISSHEVRLYGHSLFGIKLQYLQDITVLYNLKVSASFFHIVPLYTLVRNDPISLGAARYEPKGIYKGPSWDLK
ncbi:hypothetical protein QP572_14565, partial [Brevibacterium sp. UMB10442]|nr:hypothetical protein [Brevibacterium sp. UMB10442]